ncbi:MAG: hypothetical protein K2X66_16205 [Cyanobacteria bacterium]|nr:hypothetical protein [Cyanobacteriota bacterium]
MRQECRNNKAPLRWDEAREHYPDFKSREILFIGATETLMRIPNDFELAEHEKARYYKLKPPA